MTCISFPKLSKKQRPLSTLGLRREHIWEPVWAWKIRPWVEAPLIPAGNGSYGKFYKRESMFTSSFLARGVYLVTLLVYKRNTWASEMALAHHLSSVPGTEFGFLQGERTRFTQVGLCSPHDIAPSTQMIINKNGKATSECEAISLTSVQANDPAEAYRARPALTKGTNEPWVWPTQWTLETQLGTASGSFLS